MEQVWCKCGASVEQVWSKCGANVHIYVITKVEKESTGSETIPNATLFTTNLTRNNLIMNPSLREERSATDRLRHGNGSI